MAMFLATFRHSFAVLAFASVDKGLFDTETQHPFKICAPGELTSILPPKTTTGNTTTIYDARGREPAAASTAEVFAGEDAPRRLMSVGGHLFFSVA